MSVGGGTSGTIGRFLGGAAQVAIPAALEEQRARIQAQRDAVLMSYRKGEIAAEQEFRAGEGDKNRAVQEKGQAADAEYRAKVLEQGARESERNDELRGKQLDIALEGLGDQKATNAMKRQVEELDFKQKQEWNKQFAIATDTKADQAAREAAMDAMNLLAGKTAGNNYKFMMAAADEVSGEPAMLVIGDQRSGKSSRVPVTALPLEGDEPAATPPPKAAPGAAIDGYDSKEAVRAAFRSKKLTEEQALELLEKFDAAAAK